MSEARAPQGAPRHEGWGSAVNIPGPAHYIRGGRALCGPMLVIGVPLWETNQSDGPEPRPRSSETCLTCWRRKTGWKKPKKAAPASRATGPQEGA